MPNIKFTTLDHTPKRKKPTNNSHPASNISIKGANVDVLSSGSTNGSNQIPYIVSHPLRMYIALLRACDNWNCQTSYKINNSTFNIAVTSVDVGRGVAALHI
jgi:hypothetical protein